MKDVVIFLHEKILLSFIKNTEVKISAFGNISKRWEITISAHPKSLSQSQTMATFLFSNNKNGLNSFG